ncbi:MAG TPA: 1-acyl-sn-glycerol-3-phosphate acyltransferase [Candidatus Thermoplasmatota archaeon]|nr:1-acyl-sn-glycerol-3-phosphate acyltransferase [Candidatus Thermoplasmatota archaeon]
MAATTNRRPAKAAVRAKPPAGAAPPPRREADRDGLDPGTIAKLLPALRALRGYTRLKADGLRHVPDGPAILAANHTGWLGLDYALTALVLHDEAGRTPRGMVHAAWFSNPVTARFARQVGLSRVSKEAMARQLRDGHLVMVFPEGEKGVILRWRTFSITQTSNRIGASSTDRRRFSSAIKDGSRARRPVLYCRAESPAVRRRRTNPV